MNMCIVKLYSTIRQIHCRPTVSVRLDQYIPDNSSLEQSESMLPALHCSTRNDRTAGLNSENTDIFCEISSFDKPPDYFSVIRRDAVEEQGECETIRENNMETPPPTYEMHSNNPWVFQTEPCVEEL